MKRTAVRWLALLGFAVGVVASAADKWPELDMAEFAGDKPLVEPEADAEIIRHEIVIDDSSIEITAIRHYFRIRVYTERGVDRFAKIELLHDRATDIRGIEARTVHADGSVNELGRKDVFTRQVLKSGALRMTEESFSPPGLTPGAVLDYRYVEQRYTKSFFYPLRLDDRFPARTVRYLIRPLELPMPGFSLRCLTFHFPKIALKMERDGYYPFEAHNLRARKEEPLQPKMIQSFTAVLLYYSPEEQRTPAAYWAKESATLQKRTDDAARATATVQKVLQDVVAPGDTPAEKLAKIHDYCRARIVNRERDSAGLTREQRAKLPVNHSATDTLKRGSGSSANVNVAFVALARAAGLDARVAVANDRNLMLYNDTLLEPFIFTRVVAAVRQEGKWSYFDPASGYLPPGMLRWENCGTSILIADPKQGLIQPVATAPAEASVFRREGRFVLDENGVLEGDVTLTCTGYCEATEKNALDAATAEERSKQVTDEVKEALALAEVTDVTVENADNPLASLRIRYHLRVPDYAEHTGSRLFVQPAVFRKGRPPLFQAATRENTVLFDHHYAEADDVTIAVPDGYELEAGNAPPDLPLGKLGEYRVVLSYAKASRELRCQRTFSLRATAVPAAYYAALKQAFDHVHDRDSHVLTLKRAEDAAAGEKATSP